MGVKSENIEFFDIDNLSESEVPIAIKKWSEGNPNLEDALNACWENGIPTLASNIGHGIGDLPYIAMEINENNQEKIFNFMDEFLKSSKASISLLRCDGKDIFTIYGKMLNKNDLFWKIGVDADRSKDLEQTSEETQELWRTFQIMKKINDFFKIECDNRRIAKRLIISEYGNEDFEYIFKRHGMNIDDDIMGYKTMHFDTFLSKNIVKTLRKISDELEKNILDVSEFDEKYHVDLNSLRPLELCEESAGNKNFERYEEL